MDAILVAPPEYRYVTGFSVNEYLGLEYLAASLRTDNFRVRIVNCNFKTSIQKMIDTVILDRPSMIGISVPTLPNLPGAIQIIRDLRRAGYEGVLCLGGHVATFSCSEILGALKEVDVVVRGEGEQTILELMQNIKTGEPIDDINGIVFRKEGKIVINPPRDLIDNLDKLPFPSRDMLDEILKHAPAMARASMSTGRGCYGKCTYCSVHAFYDLCKGPKIRMRSPDNVVNEIEKLLKEFKLHSFFFVDDNFIGPGKTGKQRAVEIAHEIMHRGLDIDFTISCRPNDVDEALIRLLKKAGMVRIFVGIESGVQSVLDRFQKMTTVCQNVDAIATLKRCGVAWDAGFIIYDPDTTFEEFKENVTFIRKTKLFRYPAAVLLLNGLSVYPGTLIEKILKKKGLLKILREGESYFIGNARTEISPSEILTGDLLSLLDSEYEFTDHHMKVIKQVIDSVDAKLSPQYDILWPLFEEWRYISQVKKIHILMSDETSQCDIGDQMERWINNLGLLVITILETIVTIFEKDTNSQKTDYLEKIYPMIDQYNIRHFHKSFEKKVDEIRNALSSHKMII